ncbi:hypothetical protein F5Y09DRAFT_344433 [Xylaria sp. FL1042]|nr:hypothetical protein F5Y09DRAFT_344433 [Xylaria sp. FL1042]
MSVPPVSAGPLFGLPAFTQSSAFPGPIFSPPNSDVPRRVSGCKHYSRNLLASPDPEQASQAASDPFTSDVPQQPLPNMSPRRKLLVRTSGQSQFHLFSNPFASRVVMTSEATAFQEQKRLAEQAARRANKAAGTYMAYSLCREKAHQ